MNRPSLRRPSRPGKGKGRGFTLVELLVTVLVIGVLASLLVPGIAGARQTAKRVACIGNLRQIGTALAVYAADHGEALPPPARRIARYRTESPPGSPENDWTSLYALPSVLVPEYTTFDVFVCPARPRRSVPGYTYELPSLRIPLPLQYVRNPSTLPVAFDTPPRVPGNHRPPGPHLGTYSVLHVDGHVESLQADETLVRIAEWVFNAPPSDDFAGLRDWYVHFYEFVHGCPPDPMPCGD